MGPRCFAGQINSLHYPDLQRKVNEYEASGIVLAVSATVYKDAFKIFQTIQKL